MVPLVISERNHGDLSIICRLDFESTVTSRPTTSFWLYVVWDDTWFSLWLSRGWWQKRGPSQLQRVLFKVGINALWHRQLPRQSCFHDSIFLLSENKSIPWKIYLVHFKFPLTGSISSIAIFLPYYNSYLHRYLAVKHTVLHSKYSIFNNPNL